MNKEYCEAALKKHKKNQSYHPNPPLGIRDNPLGASPTADRSSDVQEAQARAERARKELRATMTSAEIQAANNRAQLLGSLTAAVTVIGRLAPHISDFQDWRRHPVLEAQRPRALGSGSATHTERSRRSQHESCEGRTMKEVQTKEEIEALGKAYLQRA
jgi:hypothetical protein